jgi:two-component system NtrC family sensor kinase
MKNRSTDFKLEQRVRELKCLYELSKIVWEEDNDLNAILSKTLAILPPAMQFPAVSEVSILVNKKVYATPQFTKSKRLISSPLSVGRKKYGTIKIGYRSSSKTAQSKLTFLPEERKLIKVVARALSLYVQRSSIEDDKQKLQMQLQHAERLAFVGELSAGIAHELNEPLGKILGFAQLIKKAGQMNAQQQEDVERIIKASLYTREIIKKLMIFSRQMPRQIVSVDLNAIISNILYFIDVRFQSRGIKILERLDPNLPSIQADAVQMSQVLVNLITNAIHALSTGGNVTIITKQKGEQISLTVKDTGTGMPAAVRKKIFEPFFTTKAVGQGTGLGLSVVLGIVESHHGSIHVSSVLGKGSKFVIHLPIKQAKS